MERWEKHSTNLARKLNLMISSLSYGHIFELKTRGVYLTAWTSFTTRIIKPSTGYRWPPWGTLSHSSSPATNDNNQAGGWLNLDRYVNSTKNAWPTYKYLRWSCRIGHLVPLNIVTMYIVNISTWAWYPHTRNNMRLHGTNWELELSLQPAENIQLFSSVYKRL